MTDDERFSLVWSVMGANDLLPRDARIPEGTPHERRLHTRRASTGHPGAPDD